MDTNEKKRGENPQAAEKRREERPAPRAKSAPSRKTPAEKKPVKPAAQKNEAETLRKKSAPAAGEAARKKPAPSAGEATRKKSAPSGGETTRRKPAPSGTEENRKKRQKLWSDFRARDPKMYWHIRLGIRGIVCNPPAKWAEPVVVKGYHIAQKIFKFN